MACVQCLAPVTRLDIGRYHVSGIMHIDHQPLSAAANGPATGAPTDDRGSGESSPPLPPSLARARSLCVCVRACARAREVS